MVNSKTTRHNPFSVGYDMAMAIICEDAKGQDPDDACPYPSGSPEANDWHFGWSAA